MGGRQPALTDVGWRRCSVVEHALSKAEPCRKACNAACLDSPGVCSGEFTPVDSSAAGTPICGGQCVLTQDPSCFPEWQPLQGLGPELHQPTSVCRQKCGLPGVGEGDGGWEGRFGFPEHWWQVKPFSLLCHCQPIARCTTLLECSTQPGRTADRLQQPTWLTRCSPKPPADAGSNEVALALPAGVPSGACAAVACGT